MATITHVRVKLNDENISKKINSFSVLNSGKHVLKQKSL